MSLFSFFGPFASRRTARRSSALFALTLAWLHSACSLDERTLTLASSDGGGSSRGGSVGQSLAGENSTIPGRAGAEQGGQAGQPGNAEGGQSGEGYGGATSFED